MSAAHLCGDPSTGGDWSRCRVAATPFKPLLSPRMPPKDICFFKPEDAEAFGERFGGERLLTSR